MDRLIITNYIYIVVHIIYIYIYISINLHVLQLIQPVQHKILQRIEIVFHYAKHWMTAARGIDRVCVCMRVREGRLLCWCTERSLSRSSSVSKRLTIMCGGGAGVEAMFVLESALSVSVLSLLSSECSLLSAAPAATLAPAANSASHSNSAVCPCPSPCPSPLDVLTSFECECVLSIIDSCPESVVRRCPVLAKQQETACSNCGGCTISAES